MTSDADQTRPVLQRFYQLAEVSARYKRPRDLVKTVTNRLRALWPPSQANPAVLGGRVKLFHSPRAVQYKFWIKGNLDPW